MSFPSNFHAHALGTGHTVYTGALPRELLFAGDRFEELWAMHPADPPVVAFGEKRLVAPRWHQAFGRDYEFAGFTSRAAPVPPILAPLLAWTRAQVDERINGVLVNWYDGEREHRIAQHKDSPIGRIPGCPIVTISLGATRTFLMHVRKRELPFVVGDRDVVVIPDATNKKHAHSVPHRPGDTGRRISVTLRGFSDEPAK
ncbi:MAG: alpha-ketoglutarate-dependent dioxygenase AlkB [Planctomycetes bacterium]|nr:alpha-ketoglutarate-dependent dioxygenase AlkB [Planctomycetota bacterium]